MTKKRYVTHENCNTLIAAVGLGLAAITAWKQFGPAPDRLDLTPQGRVDIGQPIAVESFRLPLLDTDSPSSLVGPVYWKLLVYNSLDRSVTVTSIDIYYVPPAGGLHQYSRMLDDMRDGIEPSRAITLPLTIGPREAASVLVGMNMPILEDGASDAGCLESGRSLREIERCFFAMGRDLFGNPVEAFSVSGGDASSGIAVEWVGEMIAPTFLVVMTAADGSEFAATLTYYPRL